MNKLKASKKSTKSLKKNKTSLSARAKILALLIFLSSTPLQANAASWEWLSVGNDKERLMIKLDEPMPSIQSSRNNSHQIQINTPVKSSQLQYFGQDDLGNFVDKVKLDKGNIQIDLKKAGVGYIITQPDSSTLLVEVFPDPMVERFFENNSKAAPRSNTQSQAPLIARQNPNASNQSARNANAQLSSNPIQSTQNLSQNAQVPLTSAQNIPAQNIPTQSIPIQNAPIQNELSNVDNNNRSLLNNSIEEDSMLLAMADTNTENEQITSNNSNITNNKPNAPVIEEESGGIRVNPNLPRPKLNSIPRPDVSQNQFSAPPIAPIIEATEQIDEDDIYELEDIVENPSFIADSIEVDPNSNNPITQAPQANAPVFFGNNFIADFNKDVLSSDPLANVTAPREVSQSEQTVPYQYSANFKRADDEEVSSQASTGTQISAPTLPSAPDLDKEIAALAPPPPAITPPSPAENIGMGLEEEDVIEEQSEEAEEEIDADLVPTMPTTLEEAIAQNRPIIYQDADGNVVPAPPDAALLMAQLEQLLSESKYLETLPIYQTLLTIRLDKNDNEHIRLKEKMLLGYAQALFRINEFNLAKQGQEIIDASLEAMNYNPESEAVPELLMMVARSHLALGNLEDAEGYVLMLTQLFPQERNTAPYLLYMVAEEQFERGEYVHAVNTLQLIADNFPDLPIYKDASILQTYALYRQGHYDRALPLVSFINLRWPDAYIDNPEFLSVVADIQIAQGLFDEAAETLWVRYNLNPSDPNSPELLNRLALLYYTQDDKEGANTVQLELINTFPESEFTPAAMIRLAENAFVPENPSFDTLLELYAKPNTRLPSITYQQVIDNFPNSNEAIESKVRLAAWDFFQKDYDAALRNAQNVMKNYPEKPHYNVANDILLRAFEARLSNALEEENFSRVLSLWNSYPEVHNYYQPFEDDLRVALARGYLNSGNTQEGLALLEPYIAPLQNEKYGIYAYNLYLTDYLNKGSWESVLDLDDKVKDWNMPLDVRNQHRYTVALASENLGNSARALPLWEDLVNEVTIPLYQRAYANYFLAREAENQQDLRESYQHNLDALAMFEQLQEEGSDFSDPQRIRESIAALMDVTEVAGRFAESLDWLARYASFVPQDSPDYAGLMLREARLYRKMGDMTRWQVILEDIVAREPDSVFGEMAASELNTQAMARDIDRFLEN